MKKGELWKRSLYEVIEDAEVDKSLSMELAKVGISVSYCKYMMRHIAETAEEAKENRKTNNTVKKIKNSTGDLLSIADIKSALNSTGLKGWKVRESTAEAEYLRDEVDDRDTRLTCEHKVYVCDRTPKNRYELYRITMIAYRGFFEIVIIGTDVSSSHVKLTDNGNLKSVLGMYPLRFTG
jgi:RNA:NAD 2'-phosphotransferase (TPT1/KptA family)